MKAILEDDKIVSLENVKEVHIVSGTSRRKEFYIRVEYMNGECAFLPHTADEAKAKSQLEKIFKILTETT